jgi:hypothetical protein
MPWPLRPWGPAWATAPAAHPPNCLPGRLPLSPLGCAPTPGEPATPPHPPRRNTRYHAPAPHLRDAPPGMTQRAARWAAPLPRAPGLPLAGPARPLDPRHGTPPPDTGSPPTHGPVLAAIPPPAPLRDLLQVDWARGRETPPDGGRPHLPRLAGPAPLAVAHPTIAVRGRGLYVACRLTPTGRARPSPACPRRGRARVSRPGFPVPAEG